MNIYKTWTKHLFVLSTVSLIMISIFYKFVIIDRIFNLENLKVNKNSETIIIGASHLATALDPDLLYSSTNYAKSGEPMFFTFHKLKRILKSNKNVKRVIISFSPIHVSPYGDSALFSGLKSSRVQAFSYFPTITDSAKDLKGKRFSFDYVLAKAKYHLGVPFQYMEDLKLLIHSFRRNIKETDYGFCGGHEKVGIKTHLNDKAIAKKVDLYFSNNQIGNYSLHSIEALHKITSYTKKHGIKLLVLNMPIHQKFRKIIPVDYLKKHKTVINKIVQNSNVEYINLYTYNLPDSHFLDADHVNQRGAKVLSNFISKKITKDRISSLE